MPYIEIDICCRKKEHYSALSNPIEGVGIRLSAVYNLYWYFNSKCIIYEDHETEVNILALGSIFPINTSFKGEIVTVETFVEQHENMNLDQEIGLKQS